MTKIDDREQLMGRVWPVRVTVLTILAGATTAPAMAGNQVFYTGDLVVSSSFYQGNSSTIAVGQALPNNSAGYSAGVGSSNVNATVNGSYPSVFNNAGVDANFGITSQIVLSDVSASTGTVRDSITLNAASSFNATNGLVTSFPSKSELALNLSSDGTALTFMGYAAPTNVLDVSNSNTPGVIDGTNTDTQVAASRSIGTIDAFGNLTVTPTNAYAGNNGRAAVLNNGNYYLVGNAGNSGSGVTGTTLGNLSNNTGVQMITAGSSGNTSVVGVAQGTFGSNSGYQRGFSIAQLGQSPDKTGKDDNFRGETVFNNTLYVTKGSGSNGVNTVYQVGQAGSLPTAANAGTTSVTILPGFSTTLAKSTTGTVYHPFGIWFANATTLYVADEGNQSLNDKAGGSSFATNAGGLQKWTMSNGQWSLDYTLTTGLNLGQGYTVTGGLNADGSINPNGTGASVTQYTDGLRNLTGKVNANGTVTLYAITSTVSSSGDQGADPNELVAINDTLNNTSASGATGESFATLQTAAYGQVLRGVSLAPVPIPGALWLFGSGMAGLFGFMRRRKATLVLSQQ